MTAPPPGLLSVVGMLACPVCSAALTPDSGTLRCPAGHGFDIARQGHVNLLGHAAPRNADTAVMVAARQRFLDAGHYDPVSDTIAAGLRACRRIVDAGGGTGHHLARALDGAPEAVGLVVDVSVPAARRAARAHPRLGAVVADTWRSLPVRSGVADALLCVFAPRNAAEFARVLAPGGLLVVVTPNPGHLAEAREALGLIGIQDDKLAAVRRSLAGAFEPVATRRVHGLMKLTASEVGDLVAMGPNAFHAHAPANAALRVGLDVQVTTFRRPVPR
ncbi:MAG: SAM-dependent methyltransferase [Propionibacterium sp.]|nr:SAM-dependent methyltransferase [Propionibacterium sp.]